MSAEDELVARIRELIESDRANNRVLNGIGDDAAVWQPSRSHRSIVTTDALVDGVHFQTDKMTFEEIGRRAMTANLSDVAASGARPVLATVAIGIPTGVAPDNILDLYRGMLALAVPHGCAIAGGDVTRSLVLTISITVIGEVRPSNVKSRAGGRPGDILAVTGPLGASRAALHFAGTPHIPQPRIPQGLWLAASSHVHAMMDISDGLSTDAARMCERSKCAGVIETVPVAESAVAAAAVRGEDPVGYALAGGEDFELLVATGQRGFTHLANAYRKRFGTELVPVGRLREGTGLFVVKGTREEPLAATGWDHFNEPR